MSLKRSKEIVYTFPFCFIILEYVLGLYFNDIFPDFLKYSDEALAIILLLWTTKYTLIKRRGFFNKEIRVFILIVLFYLVYSFWIHSNKSLAILGDLTIQLKPFIAFYMFSYIGFVLNDSQKKILKRLSVCLFIFALIVVIFSFFTIGLMWGITSVFGHVNSYGISLVLIALVYLYCSDIKNKKDIIIFLIILTFSLFSTRAKIYGIYATVVTLVLILRGNVSIKISLKNIIISISLFLLVVYVAWDKISFYFFDYDIVDSELAIARPSLYITAWKVLIDYFPFGSGLASFASHYSGVYYSDIYSIYGLDMVWGLMEEDPNFVTDTGYPSLAQFGVVGVILYFIFFKRIISEANWSKQVENNKTNYLVIVSLLFTLAIQCIADAAFTSNKGFFIMMLLALLLVDCREKSKNITK